MKTLEKLEIAHNLLTHATKRAHDLIHINNEYVGDLFETPCWIDLSGSTIKLSFEAVYRYDTSSYGATLTIEQLDMSDEEWVKHITKLKGSIKAKREAEQQENARKSREEKVRQLEKLKAELGEQ